MKKNMKKKYGMIGLMFALAALAYSSESIAKIPSARTSSAKNDVKVPDLANFVVECKNVFIGWNDQGNKITSSFIFSRSSDDFYVYYRNKGGAKIKMEMRNFDEATGSYWIYTGYTESKGLNFHLDVNNLILVSYQAEWKFSAYTKDAKPDDNTDGIYTNDIYFDKHRTPIKKCSRLQ